MYATICDRRYSRMAVNILLIQLKRIGDLVLTTPAMAALRQKFPEATVSLIISRNSAPLLPALPNVDRAYVMRRGVSDLPAFLAIARRRFDVCLDFTRNSRSAVLTFLSGAK